MTAAQNDQTFFLEASVRNSKSPPFFTVSRLYYGRPSSALFCATIFQRSAETFRDPAAFALNRRIHRNAFSLCDSIENLCVNIFFAHHFFLPSDLPHICFRPASVSYTKQVSDPKTAADRQFFVTLTYKIVIFIYYIIIPVNSQSQTKPVSDKERHPSPGKVPPPWRQMSWKEMRWRPPPTEAGDTGIIFAD